MKMEGRWNCAKQYGEDREYWEKQSISSRGVLWNSLAQLGQIRRELGNNLKAPDQNFIPLNL